VSLENAVVQKADDVSLFASKEESPVLKVFEVNHNRLRKS